MIQPFWLDPMITLCQVPPEAQGEMARRTGTRPTAFPSESPLRQWPGTLVSTAMPVRLAVLRGFAAALCRSAPLSATGMLSGVLADVTLRVRGRRRLAVTVDAHVGAGEGFGVWWEACLRLTRRGRRRLAVTVDAPGAARCPHRRPLE